MVILTLENRQIGLIAFHETASPTRAALTIADSIMAIERLTFPDLSPRRDCNVFETLVRVAGVNEPPSWTGNTFW